MVASQLCREVYAVFDKAQTVVVVTLVEVVVVVIAIVRFLLIQSRISGPHSVTSVSTERE